MHLPFGLFQISRRAADADVMQVQDVWNTAKFNTYAVCTYEAN